HGMYSVVSNGITMVNGVNRLTLEMSTAINNKTYGISDYTVNIKESGIAFVPTNGSMKAQIDTIAEDKGYIDKLAHMSGFLLTTFNTMHQQGAGIDGTDSSFGNDDGTDTYKGPSYGVNYWGDDNTLYTWDATDEVVKAVELKDIKRTVEVDDTQTDASGNTIRTPKVTIGGTQVSETTLDGINIINALAVNTAIKETGGQNLIAARKLVVEQNVSDTGALENGYSVKVNGSGDGTNATNIATLINMDQANVHSTSYIVYNATTTGGTTKLMDMADDTMTTDNMKYRALDVDSLNAYYSAAVSKLGSDSESVDDKSDAQDQLIEQITNWRSSTSGVDWNEELSNMIMFQKGYSACSRCLTTMDEMLDRLINSTGTVGR
ncbi:flagellar basal body rod C-terminal domain-containing protein, partial [Selenomonas sp.]